MAIETLAPKTEKRRPIQIIRSVLVQGQHFDKGAQIKVPEADAFDLVAAGQAKFLDLK